MEVRQGWHVGSQRVLAQDSWHAAARLKLRLPLLIKVARLIVLASGTSIRDGASWASLSRSYRLVSSAIRSTNGLELALIIATWRTTLLGRTAGTLLDLSCICKPLVIDCSILWRLHMTVIARHINHLALVGRRRLCSDLGAGRTVLPELHVLAARSALWLTRLILHAMAGGPGLGRWREARDASHVTLAFLTARICCLSGLSLHHLRVGAGSLDNLARLLNAI